MFPAQIMAVSITDFFFLFSYVNHSDVKLFRFQLPCVNFCCFWRLNKSNV